LWEFLPVERAQETQTHNVATFGAQILAIMKSFRRIESRRNDDDATVMASCYIPTLSVVFISKKATSSSPKMMF
jgi:hypothetical protein